MRRSLVFVIAALLSVTCGVSFSGISADPAAAAGAVFSATYSETVTVSLDTTTVVSFSRPATFVAAHWQGEERAQVTLAFSSDGVTFGPSVDAGRDDAEGDGRSGTTYGDVLAADGAVAVRVTTDTPLAQLSVTAMDPGVDPTPTILPSAAGPAPTTTLTPAAQGQPSIISRAGWGANSAYLSWAPRFCPPTKVIIHHTADGSSPSGSPDSYKALVRSIYHYHAVTRDWGDIAYNYLIDPLGNIYEGRYSDNDPTTPPGLDAFGNGVAGAHTYNFNTGTVGIAMLGTYSTKDISPAARASLERLVAWVTQTHGIDPLGSGRFCTLANPSSTRQTNNIGGHRDYGSTDCPGATFYATLGLVRQKAASLTGPVAPLVAPAPTYLRLTLNPSPSTAGQAVTVTATLLGEPSRTPVAGATISFALGPMGGEGAVVGEAKTGSNGVASIKLTPPEPGRRWLTARVTSAGAAYRGATSSIEVDVAAPAPKATRFSDVYEDDRFTAAILGLAEAGVVNGKADGRFCPRDPVTRQQFAKMVVLGCDYPVSESDVCSFKDVLKSGPGDLFPDNYVAVCAARGITLGRTAHYFDPHKNITRMQVASMVVRAAQDRKPGALKQPVAGWKGVLPAGDPDHGKNVALAECSGFFAGIDLGAFAVTGAATREEIAQIIWNLRNK